MNPMDSAIERAMRRQLDPFGAGRTCGKKIQHQSLDAARKQAKLMRKKYGPKYEAYECRYCGSFHVGHAR